MLKYIWTISVVLVPVLIGCSEPTKATTESSTPKTTQAPAPVEDENSINLTLEANDQMQYNKKELRVKAGQTVTLTLKHVGKMPLEAMGHNFVLLKTGTDLAAFATEALKAKDTDYIPAGDAVIAHTEMIGGGKSTSVTFTAPEVGIYDYICSFPAHYALMNGKFIVE